ncbi:MAG: tetratricopeptide repeat protein, partial [Lentisphaeria bacterium]|nr:tetratricopeptide repeat protein [Lentisphaeria bacterium]
RRRELDADFEGALRSYSAALGEDPTRLEGWLGQLWVLYELEEHPEVDLWARKALEHFPENPALLAMRSLATFAEGRRRDGRALNDSALAGKGNCDLVWLARAEIMMADNARVGEECLVHARILTTEPDLNRLRSAGICFRNRRHRLALKELQELTARRPDAAGAWFLLGRVYDALGDILHAAEAFGEALELTPGNRAFRDTWEEFAHRRRGIGGFLRRFFGR